MKKIFSNSIFDNMSIFLSISSTIIGIIIYNHPKYVQSFTVGQRLPETVVTTKVKDKLIIPMIISFCLPHGKKV